MPGLVPGITS